MLNYQRLSCCCCCCCCCFKPEVTCFFLLDKPEVGSIFLDLLGWFFLKDLELGMIFLTSRITSGMFIWLVVWNMTFIFPYIGKFIIPTDFHIFQGCDSTTNQLWLLIGMVRHVFRLDMSKSVKYITRILWVTCLPMLANCKKLGLQYEVGFKI